MNSLFCLLECAVFALPIKFSLSQPMSFLSITLLILSPVQGRATEWLYGALLLCLAMAKPIHFPIADSLLLRILPVLPMPSYFQICFHECCIFRDLCKLEVIVFQAENLENLLKTTSISPSKRRANRFGEVHLEAHSLQGISVGTQKK